MPSFNIRRPSKSSLPQKVIIVEDDAILGLELETTLKEAGIEHVEVCSTTSCTISRLREGTYDAIVLDGQLADSDDGFAIADLVSALGEEDMRIVFQTGSPEDIPEHLLSLGPVLAKPYDPQKLVEALTEKPRASLLAMLRGD